MVGGICTYRGTSAAMAAQTQSLPATGGNVDMTPLAHAHVQLEFGGKVIHVDPNTGTLPNAFKPADLILVTDIHADHMDPDGDRAGQEGFDDLHGAAGARGSVPGQDGSPEER